MSARVLIIDDQDDFRRLLAHHVATGFDSPSIAEYEPAARGRLPADFSGSAYDAVLLGDTPGEEFGIGWLRDLSRRNGFPPIIYFLSRPIAGSGGGGDRMRARTPACRKQKVDHGALVAALRAAQARRGQFSRAGVARGRVAARDALRRRDDPRLPLRQPARREPGVERLPRARASRPARRSRSRCCTSRRTRARACETSTASCASTRSPPPSSTRTSRASTTSASADDHAFIAMEYFPLGDLRGRIKQGIAAAAGADVPAADGRGAQGAARRRACCTAT